MVEDLLTKFYSSKDENERKDILDLMLNDYQEYLDRVLINIKNKIELRNNAYLLNILSKKKKVVEYLNKKFSKEHFLNLIGDDDPKTRKNTYVFMGNYCDKNYTLDLIKCLKEEKVNYCISSLVLAIGNYNIKNLDEVMNKYLEVLKNRLNNNEILEVHYREIVNSISKVVSKSLNINSHEFTGFNQEETIYLTCMPSLINATLSDVKKHYTSASKYKDGVVIKTNNYENIFRIRTFYEALLMFGDCSNLNFEQVKTNILNFLNSDFLFSTHKGEDAFFYRIEFVSSVNKEEKVKTYNEINEMVLSAFSQKYINNPSNYEFEIRIIDNKGSYDIYYKLYTYKDNRYNYRQKDLPASINPTSAAIMLNEVSKYLNKDARVYDPFCGTSTFLIEKSYLKTSKLVGSDIDSKAIEYSKINSAKANVKISLYHENCLNHNGVYDEIISNMPYGNRVGTHRDNEILYKRFINRLSYLLVDNGVAILLTTEISLMKKLLKNNRELKLLKEIYTETGGLNPHLFVIKKV